MQIVNHYRIRVSAGRFEAHEHVFRRGSDGLDGGAGFGDVFPIYGFPDAPLLEVEDLEAGEVVGAGGGEGRREGEEGIHGGKLSQDGGFAAEGPVEGGDLAAVRDVEGAGSGGGEGGGGIASVQG